MVLLNEVGILLIENNFEIFIETLKKKCKNVEASTNEVF
jgi:hypothetical protein